MKLTRLQFNFLTFIESHSGESLTQRDIAFKMDISLGSVNKFITFSLKEKLIAMSKKQIILTDKGYSLLEPCKVKNAIIIAAGVSERLSPVTLKTPKPLVTVNGVRIIDTIIDSLLEKGIVNIYVVVGYKKEMFKVLLEKYPSITLIENPRYNEAHNIASLYEARNYLDSSYIIEADLFIMNKDIISKYEYATSYKGIFEEETDDWCFSTKNSWITKTSIGGNNVYRMIGISYWNKEDSIKLKKDIEDVINTPGGKENFWDKVPLTICKKHYSILVNEISSKDVIEIDNYKELVELDSSYK